MKKIISLCLAFIMLFSVTVISFADYRGPVDGINMSPGINPVVKIRNETLYDYVIYARDMKGMTNGDFTLYYDTSALKFVDAKILADFDGTFVNDIGGEVYFSFLFKEENEDDALKMYVLTFEYSKPDVYPSLKVTNMAGTFIRSVADVKVVDGKDPESDIRPGGDRDEDGYLRGDVNGDGKVTASDARTALRVAAGLVSVSLEEFKRADLNSDGEVYASEARTILRIAAGLE